MFKKQGSAKPGKWFVSVFCCSSSFIKRRWLRRSRRIEIVKTCKISQSPFYSPFAKGDEENRTWGMACAPVFLLCAPWGLVCAPWG